MYAFGIKLAEFYIKIFNILMENFNELKRKKNAQHTQKIKR